MNKLTKLLSIIAVAATIGTGVAGAAGCGGGDNGGETGRHKHSYQRVDNGNGTHQEHCGVEGCDKPDRSKEMHTWGEDGTCTKCDAKNHTHNYVWVDNGDGTHKQHCNVDGCDKPDINEGTHDFSGANGTCKDCGAENHSYGPWQYNFDEHYRECSDAGCENPVQSGPHNFVDGVCDVCGSKFATYELIPSEMEATTYKEAYTSGIFTILGDTTIRTRSRENYKVYDYKNGEGTAADTPVQTGFNASKSVQYNGANRGISVNAIAPGRLTIYVDNGAGGKTKTDKQTIQLTRPGGQTETISYYCGDIYAITINCDTAGEYKITRGNADGVGTTDLYYAKFETVVGVTPVEKIQISDEGKTTFIKGEKFDASKLQLQIVRQTTGVIEPLDVNDKDVTVDDSGFDGNTAGSYEINVSYKADGNTFTAKYTVTVYTVEAVELGFNKMDKSSKNTAAGNGQYINTPVKQFYFSNEDLSLDGLTVKAVLDNGSKKVIVTDGFGVEGFEKGKAGKQTVKVYWKDVPALYKTFDVYVADYTAADVTVSETITVNVDGSFTDDKVGVTDSGAYQFKTIQQSLDFLNALNLKKEVKKVINLAEGLYTERLEVTIPNLTIKGVDRENTIIEWDSLVGIEDESGYVHVTDSTATLNIRDTAVGFVIEGVTISNWFNSEAHFTEKFGAGYGEHRALAMLVQADKVVIDDCKLLGYQDTIEFFTGRQMVTNTYICGRTDFIFGTNNTTYFKNCEIESIVSGGYVTAFKGCNKGDSDWVQYGTIFDECDFIAPADVVSAKNTSLGRTWGKYAAVAYINCNMAGHISTTSSRYTPMSGAQPTDATVKFVEYGNSGAGAVTSSAAGEKILTAAEAANYTDMSVIFGKTNGKLTYGDIWDGSKGV